MQHWLGQPHHHDYVAKACRPLCGGFFFDSGQRLMPVASILLPLPNIRRHVGAGEMVAGDICLTDPGARKCFRFHITLDDLDGTQAAEVSSANQYNQDSKG